MTRIDKRIDRILSGKHDASIEFEELCLILKQLGFTQRIRGSHNIFRKEGIKEHLNLQRDGGKAKTYQVRQVRNLILKYRLSI